MNIAFKTKKLGKTLSKEAAIKAAYGKLARRIMRRMAVLAAAQSLADVSHLPPERCHELKGDRKGTFAVDLDGNNRLVFEPDHDPVPVADGGGIDLQQVTAVKILGMKDYH
jgi:proteic killer suppression protein